MIEQSVSLAQRAEQNESRFRNILNLLSDPTMKDTRKEFKAGYFREKGAVAQSLYLTQVEQQLGVA
jgi:hypothetical protein